MIAFLADDLASWLTASDGGLTLIATAIISTFAIVFACIMAILVLAKAVR